jgi:HlyD family secretion protein
VVLLGGMITALTQARSRGDVPAQVPDLATTATVAATAATLPGQSSGAPLPGVTIQDNRAVVEGRFVPLASYDLRFETSGMISEVLVEEGATVAKGDIIARLDTRALEFDIKAAEAELALVRAEYNLVVAGLTPEEIAEARTRLDRAKAQRVVMEESVSPEDIAATQEQLAALKVKLAALEAKPTAQDIAVAKAQLEQEKLHLNANRDTLAAEKATLEAKLEVAANQLRDAQDAYRRIKLVNDQGSPSQDEKDAEARALRAMQNAEQSYKVAQIQLDEARKVEISTLAAKEAEIRVAQARYELALANKPVDQIAQTKADIAQVEAILNKQRADYRNAQLALVDSEISISEATLAKATAKPRPVDLAPLEARIKQTELLLQQRRFALEKMLLRAPASGTLASLDLHVGQLVGETPVGVLADTTSWVIQVSDISEIVIVNLAEGDSVGISIYALPDLQVTGTITHIQPIGRSVVGQDTAYSLIVTPDKTDPRLRWNMTAAIQLSPGR